MKVLLAEDHALVRQGMKHLISLCADIEIVDEAATGVEVLERLAVRSFDAVLLDVSMPGPSGAELVTEIRKRKNSTPILVLTMHDEPHIVRKMLAAGANGYLTKDCPAVMLEEAIAAVAGGKCYIQPDIAGKLILDQPLHERLSSQEARILGMLAQGQRVSDIACELGISSRTVSTYKVRLMQKLEIENDAELIRYADAHGLKG